MKDLYSVITGDVVGSTLIQNDYHDMLHNIAFDVRKHIDPTLRFEIYRGDSFQILTKNIQKSLIIGVLFRAGFKSFAPTNKFNNSWDIRLSIGLGHINENDIEEISIGLMDGEAFQLSGRALDSMKDRKERLKVSVEDKHLDTLFAAVFPLIDNIISDWSHVQSAAVYTHLLNPKLTQAEIGKKIETSQRSVSKVLDASKIELIKPFIEHYKQLLKWYLNK